MQYLQQLCFKDTNLLRAVTGETIFTLFSKQASQEHHTMVTMEKQAKYNNKEKEEEKLLDKDLAYLVRCFYVPEKSFYLDEFAQYYCALNLDKKFNNQTEEAKVKEASAWFKLLLGKQFNSKLWLEIMLKYSLQHFYCYHGDDFCIMLATLDTPGILDKIEQWIDDKATGNNLLHLMVLYGSIKARSLMSVQFTSQKVFAMLKRLAQKNNTQGKTPIHLAHDARNARELYEYMCREMLDKPAATLPAEVADEEMEEPKAEPLPPPTQVSEPSSSFAAVPQRRQRNEFNRWNTDDDDDYDYKPPESKSRKMQ